MRYPKVQPGDPIRTRASFHNALVDLLANTRNAGRNANLSPQGGEFYTKIIAKNGHTAYMPARGVGRAVDTLIDPSEHLGRFVGRPGLVVEPASGSNGDAPIVVAVNRIDNGASGLAAIGGVIQVQIEVSDAAHRFATPSTSTAWQLDSDATSGLPILWKESGTGTKWALVEVRETEPAGTGVVPAIVSASTTTANAWEFEYTLKRAGATGTESSDWTEGETLSPAYNTAERIGFTGFTAAPVSNGVGVLAVEVDGAWYFTLAPIEGACS